MEDDEIAHLEIAELDAEVARLRALLMEAYTAQPYALDDSSLVGRIEDALDIPPENRWRFG